MKSLLHISDLHFSKITANPSQIFSKRWIGNLNLFLFRKNQICLNLPEIFLSYIKDLKPDYILISGDFTSTALKKEYDLALSFLKKIKDLGIQVYAIPGNHDAYTKSSYEKKSFYNSFKEIIPFKGEFDFDLETHKVAGFLLKKDLYLVLIDASCYTSYFQSNGIFSFEIEQHLESLLESIPETAKIWIACHYPFFEHENKRRILIGAKKLKNILEKYSQIEMYFHGHTHRQAICDLRSNQLPIISDSGSLTLKNRSTFNHLVFDQNVIELSRYHHETRYVAVEKQTLIRTP